MGNSNRKTSLEPDTSSSPACKRAKSSNGSVFLRRFTSKHLIRSEKDGNRKRKHLSISETPSTSSGSIISIDRHWPSFTDCFEPQFPWTSNVSESDFVILNQLGQGRFATVFRAIRRSTNQQVAIKIQKKANILRADAEKQIKNEITVNQMLRSNPFIAEFIESWQTSLELFTVIEYVDGCGDLFTLFSEYGEFSEQMTCLYAVEIALGLEYIHSKNIIFRDVKMENLTLDSSLHIKFVDFGFSKCLQSGSKTRTICGSLPFMAPEIAAEQEYGLEVDWWSLGVTLFVMRTGQFPFPNNLASSHRDLIFDHQEFPETCSNEFKSLIIKLLQLNPSKRLSSAKDLFNQPFFENVNFEGIRNKDVCPFEILKTECKSIDRLRINQSFDEHYKNFDFYFD